MLALFVLATGCTASTAVRPPTAAATGPAVVALAGLAVNRDASMTGYRRDGFGQAWSDDVVVDGGHNGCDTRNDVLRRDLAGLVVKPGTQGCVVMAGSLHDPYTGRALSFRRGADTSPLVQIDHVVALGNAWQTGAQALTAAQRQDLANDPLELLAVDGPTNQDKGDGDAAAWLPPDSAQRCAYVARQIAVKQDYRLWVRPEERAAMLRVLAACPGQPLPTSVSTAVPPPRPDG